MQVVCERSNTGNDVRCDICGQGFVVHWASLMPRLRSEARVRIIHALRSQHRNDHSGHHAHTEARFTVSAAGAEPSFAASVLLANVAA